MRLLHKEPSKDDPSEATKALSCYGLYLPEIEESWLRFVDGRPVSAITTRFLQWGCRRLEARGKKALLLIWDNASWHKSRRVREWIGAHNRQVKESGRGVHIVACFLPTKSPWLNAIEPKWIHGKRTRSRSPRDCSAHTSWQTGSAGSWVVRTTSIYLFPKRSPDRALEGEFSELPLNGVLGTSATLDSPKFASRLRARLCPRLWLPASWFPFGIATQQLIPHYR